jgi:hypothetical protein
MVAPADHAEGIAHHRFEPQVRVRRPWRGEPEVDLLPPDARLHAAGVGVQQVHRDARVIGAEGGDHPRHQLDRDRRQRGHPDAAAPARGDVPDLGDRAVHVVEQPLGGGQELRAVVGQQHPARGAVEQPHAEFFLELVDLDG